MTFLLSLLISCGNDKYEILKEDVSMNVSRINVKLAEKVDMPELVVISNEIRASRKSYAKVWISFYLPDFLPESGIRAWAMGSFTPELEVEIFGENKVSSKVAVSKIVFPHYSDVMKMIEESRVFQGNCVEKISENPLHIRVSSEFLSNESISVIKEQVKRDIVFMVFQAFSETDIDEITVTSIPMIRSSFNPNLAYDGKLNKSLKETKTVSRAEAIRILEIYIKTTSFKDLYKIHETMFITNNKFDLLQYGQLENVYNSLK